MKIIYEFFFENERFEVFDLTFRKSDLSLQPFPVENDQPWTKLEFNRCGVCTLKATEHKYCPVARNLSYVLLQFKNDYSYEKVRVKVTSEQRVNEKETSLQDGISPLMGLIMATSAATLDNLSDRLCICRFQTRSKRLFAQSLPISRRNTSVR